MSNYDASGISKGNMSSTSIVTQAYLNVTQSITQGFFAGQLTNVDCGKNSNICNECIKTAKKYKLADKDFSQACPICFCTLENLNINSIISINLDAKMFNNSESNFKTQIINSLTEQASLSGTNLFGMSKDKQNTLTNTASKIFNEMNTAAFQSSLQELKVFQILSLKNPNTEVINADLNLTTKYISNLLQDNKITSSALSEMDSNILSIVTSVTNAGFAVLISWIVTLALVFVIALVAVFSADIVMELLTLYATS